MVTPLTGGLPPTLLLKETVSRAGPSPAGDLGGLLLDLLASRLRKFSAPLGMACRAPGGSGPLLVVATKSGTLSRNSLPRGKQ